MGSEMCIRDRAGISVPLIVSGAGISEPGRSSDALVHAVDLFATVAELSGIDPSGLGSTRRPNDSVSFVPHLRNPGAAPLRKTLFAERFLPSGYAPSAQSYALRDSRYKLIFHLFKSASPETEVDGWSSSLQLFDLERDPEEKSDLLARGARPSHPDLEPEAASAYQRLRQQLHGFASAARSTRSEHRSPR